jgi:glucosamine--fructose-6-phosphate aminotransferase (isomerizing)
LIDKGTPVIAICTQEGTNSIVRNNLTETEARGSLPIIISTVSLSEPGDDIEVPDVNHYLSPLITIVVAQLLAYYVATMRGNDVDKPKNLAKSVTVE